MFFSRLFLAMLGIFYVSAGATSAQTPATANAQAAKTAEALDPKRPIRDKWALIVGISKFESSKVPPLKYSTKDARDFYNYLIKEANFQPTHVRVLLDEKATRRRIISELGNKFLARLARPGDLIVLFFSTHGSPSQMDLRGKSYLVTYDADPEDLDATGIGMVEVNDKIHSRVLSDRVVLVLDACHSGSSDPNAKGMYRVGNMDAQALAEGSGQLVICSSRPDEQSWESKRYQNGVFTKNLLEALRSSGGKIPLGSAFEKAQQLVETEVREDRPGARQSPMLNAKWSGSDIVLSVPAAEPQKVAPTVLADLEPDSVSNFDSTVKVQVGDAKPIEPATQTIAMAATAKPPSFFPTANQKLVLTSTYFSNVSNPKEALTAAYEASGANFNNVEFYWRKAKILIQLQKWQAAMQCLKGCIVDDPNQSDYYLARALCYHHMKMHGLAVADIQTAQFKNPLVSRQIEFGE
ncbi:MAG: hypothetical protein C0507_14510 [Cyanobacteria bacterium PR.3.49]|nr:hypothetical protein [Cyanobacteria bacterium PR.3.49]